MSYKDTLEKLKSLRSNIEKEVPQLLVELDVYEKTVRQGAEDVNKLLSTLDVGNWRFFTVDPAWGFSVYYINNDIMRAGQYKFTPWSVYFPNDLNINILDDILEAVMRIIRGSTVDYYPFVEEVTKVYNIIERVVTQEFNEKILNIVINCREAYEELKREGERARKQLGSKIDELEDLEYKAASEWQSEENKERMGSELNTWRRYNPELDCARFVDVAFFMQSVSDSLYHNRLVSMNLVE